MRPAFSSTKSAAAFALLLLLLLLSPVLARKEILPPREEAYSRQGWGSGPYPWIENQIFQETNAIDIAFVGSSHIFNDINTPDVQAKLSARLGRPAVVRTIAWGGAGYDSLYFIARDLLAHRRVKMLVFYDENPIPGVRHNQTPAWFRFGEDGGLLTGLPLREQGLFYFAAIIGTPRNLLSLVRPNLPAPLITGQKNYWEIVADGPNPVVQLGSLSYRRGFGLKPPADATPFVEFKPATGATSADAAVFSETTKVNFEFSSTPLPDWQIHFAKKLAELFQQYRVQPVMLHLPVLAEAHASVMAERADWPAIFGSHFKLLGVAPGKLFGGLSDDEVHKLYGDPVHFNRNGQEYFTPLITPVLIQLYEACQHP
jgi:hypothetical protein